MTSLSKFVFRQADYTKMNFKTQAYPVSISVRVISLGAGGRGKITYLEMVPSIRATVGNSFSGVPESHVGVARRRGSPPARSGLAVSTAGEEPRQDPARNWPDTGKRIACRATTFFVRP
jgi:hypothetical protein